MAVTFAERSQKRWCPFSVGNLASESGVGHPGDLMSAI